MFVILVYIHHVPVFIGSNYLLNLFGTYQHLSLFGVFHLMEQDRSIERDFFGGKLCGIAATNALELGIDVGHIDVTLLLGFPDSIAR